MKLNEKKVKEQLIEIKIILGKAKQSSYSFQATSREQIAEAKGRIETLLNVIDWEDNYDTQTNV